MCTANKIHTLDTYKKYCYIPFEPGFYLQLNMQDVMRNDDKPYEGILCSESKLNELHREGSLVITGEKYDVSCINDVYIINHNIKKQGIRHKKIHQCKVAVEVYKEITPWLISCRIIKNRFW